MALKRVLNAQTPEMVKSQSVRISSQVELLPLLLVEIAVSSRLTGEVRTRQVGADILWYGSAIQKTAIVVLLKNEVVTAYENRPK